MVMLVKRNGRLTKQCTVFNCFFNRVMTVLRNGIRKFILSSTVYIYIHM